MKPKDIAKFLKFQDSEAFPRSVGKARLAVLGLLAVHVLLICVIWQVSDVLRIQGAAALTAASVALFLNQINVIRYRGLREHWSFLESRGLKWMRSPHVLNAADYAFPVAIAVLAWCWAPGEWLAGVGIATAAFWALLIRLRQRDDLIDALEDAFWGVRE